MPLTPEQFQLWATQNTFFVAVIGVSLIVWFNIGMKALGLKFYTLLKGFATRKKGEATGGKDSESFSTSLSDLPEIPFQHPPVVYDVKDEDGYLDLTGVRK